MTPPQASGKVILCLAAGEQGRPTPRISCMWMEPLGHPRRDLLTLQPLAAP